MSERSQAIASGAIRALLLVILALGLFPVQLHAESCAEVVGKLNQKLTPHIDEVELANILETLNATGNGSLPPQFITKGQARGLGWRPGTDLWSYPELRGKSLGGDVFQNRERRLPDGRRVWREADLDFNGGRRGPKRLVFSEDGLRYVTVDHYSTFREVPPCR